MLCATTACTFSTSPLPKAVRHWCVLYIFTWKRASRRNGVQFFIFHLANCLRARRFRRAYFSTLQSHESLEKHSESRLSYLFAHLRLLSSDLFSSDSSHLCFSTVHIVGSFTSKLPSINEHIHLQVNRHVLLTLNMWVTHVFPAISTIFLTEGHVESAPESLPAEGGFIVD